MPITAAMRVEITSIAIAIALGVPAAFAATWFFERQNTVVWSGECSATGFSLVGNLQVDCNGQTYDVTGEGNKLVLHYLKNPGPLQCTITRSDVARCDDRPFRN